MNKKTGLSVVLATFNEEGNIKNCLESVKDLADEIIVVDEDSTDKTREIAKELGARVFKSKHEPIFHITKNKAIRKAKYSWILQLDADEQLSPDLRTEIKRVVKGEYFGLDSWLSPLKKSLNKVLPIFHPPVYLTGPAAAYWLTRKNFFITRYLDHTGQYPDPVIRLFQNGLAILPAKDVHEQMSVRGSVGWLKSDLLHLSTPEFGRYLLRENRYSSLEASFMYEVKTKVTFLNTILYLFVKPLSTFFHLYVRHRGFLDGFPGFVFSLYSGFHHAFSYMKLWEIYKNNDTNQS